MSDVIVVAKRSAYAAAILEKRDPDAMRLLEAGDPSVARWMQAHTDHERALARVQELLLQGSARVRVVHGAHSAFDPGDAKLVVTVGGDGTLLAASHHVGNCPILGVNSAPRHSRGFFCAANLDNAPQLLQQALAGAAPSVRLSRMQVELGTTLCSKRVLNEALFCHANPAATSRYILEFEGRSEEQRSSGIWVGTAAGSTGALRSAGGKVLPFASRQLQLVVREPSTARGEPYRWSSLIAESGQVVSVRSKMRDAKLFLDGPFGCFDVGLGEVVHFRVSDEPLTLLGLSDRRDPPGS